jgi:hypothetical protein
MSAFRNVFLGLIAVTALSAPALTQSPRPSPNEPYGPPKTSDGITLFYPKTGRTVSGHLSDKDMQTTVQQGQPVKGPMMVVLSGGQAYVVPDMAAHKMPDGTTVIAFFERRIQ